MNLHKRRDYILTVVGYAFLGFFTVIIITFIQSERKSFLSIFDTKVDNYQESYHIPEIKLLTDEEVEMERDKFSIGTKPQGKVNIINDYQTTVLSEEEVAQINSIRSTSLSESNSQTRVKQINLEKDTNVNLLASLNLSESAKNPIDKSRFATLSGYIHTIDHQNGSLLMTSVSASNLTVIETSKPAKVKINDQLIPFSSLKVGDKITIEGFYREKTSILVASIILLTGQKEIIPTN